MLQWRAPFNLYQVKIFDQHTYLHKFTASAVAVRRISAILPNIQNILKHQSKHNLWKKPDENRIFFLNFRYERYNLVCNNKTNWWLLINFIERNRLMKSCWVIKLKNWNMHSMKTYLCGRFFVMMVLKWYRNNHSEPL